MPPGEFQKRSGYLPDVQKAIQLPPEKGQLMNAVLENSYGVAVIL